MAEAVEIHIVLHAVVHVGDGLIHPGVVVDLGLLLGLAAHGGDGLVPEGNGLDLVGEDLGLLDGDLVVDLGGQNHGADLDLVDVVDNVPVLDIQDLILVLGLAGLGVGAGDLVEVILGQEGVVSGAVVVAVDNLQPLAAVIALEVPVPGLGVDVLVLELAEGDAVGDIALLIGVAVGGLGAHEHVAGDLILVLAVNGIVVSGGEDALEDVHLLSSDLLLGADHAVVADGIGAPILAVVASDICPGVVGISPSASLHSPLIVGAFAGVGVLGNILVSLVEGRLSSGVVEHDGELQTLVAGEVALAAEVQIELSVLAAGQAGLVLELLVGGDIGVVAGLELDVLAGVAQGQHLGIHDVGVAGLADIVQGGGVVQGADVVLGDLQVGLALGHDLLAVEVGLLVGDDHALDSLQAQVGGQVGVSLGVAVELVVVHSGHQDGAEQQLGDYLAAGGRAQQGGGDVAADLQGVGTGGGLHSPVGAGKLVHLAVANGPQDHRQGLIAGDGIVGPEAAVAVALDVLCIGAVVDVAGIPGAGGDVGKAVVVRVQGYLTVLHIAGGDAVDDGGNLSAGDGCLRLIAAVGVAPEHFQAGQDINGFAVSLVDVRLVAESRVGGDYEREAHNQSQGQCENLLKISHGGFGPPF